MKIIYCCFEVSSLCNMDCKFCFSEWRKNGKQLPIEKVKHIIDVLVDCGLKAINLTGGDPLVRDDIIEIVKYCKAKGLMTIISTNGILLPEKEKVLENIDAINLPLDSFEPSIHNKMRPCAMENHHKHILYLIDYISDKYPKVKIKINTMVGKLNIDDIPNMLKIMDGRVLSWKLGKFFASGYGKNYKDEFDIDDTSYEKLMEFVSRHYNSSYIVEEKFEASNKYNIFIDGKGLINEVTDKEVVTHGEIDKLPSLYTSRSEIKKEYLEKVYNYGENK